MAHIIFANLADGLQAMSLFDQAFADAGGWNTGGSALIQITTASGLIIAGTPAVAIVRAAPVTTSLTLPSVASQLGQPIHVFDWSSAVTGHTITVTPNGSETIMLAANWPIFSNSVSLGSATFYPSTALGGWYIAP